jgi:hypothetical protein
MEWLGHVGGWKIGAIFAMFALLFVFRSLAGGKPDYQIRRRRRRAPPGKSRPPGGSG